MAKAGSRTGRGDKKSPPKKNEPKKKEPEKKEDESIGDAFSRATVPRQMTDPDQRKAWDLEDENGFGPYIIELNLQHVDGLAGSANAFVDLHDKVVADPDRRPVRIGKTYYSCNLKVTEWRKLVMEDESNADKQAADTAWKDPSKTAVSA